jgi:hypothetical protein
MNSSVPVLHPRGLNRPRPTIVRVGEVVLGFGSFGWVLRILDWIGKGETAMDVYRLFPRFMSFAGNSIFQGSLIVLGFVLLWKYAQASAKVSQSQLVHPETKLPFEHPVYPAFRRAGWTFIVSVLLAAVVFAMFTNPVRSYLVISDYLPKYYQIPAPAIRTETRKHGNDVSPTTHKVAPVPSGSSQKPAPPDSTSKAVAPPPSPQTTAISTTLPTSAPAAIIPSDPVEAVQTVNHMRNSLAEVLGKKETITFLMSWTGDDPTFMAFMSQLLSSACRTTPRQCWFTQASGNERDLDRPPIQGSGRRGITIHGNDAVYLAIALNGWFTTYDTSSIPDRIEGYKDPATKELIWIEIGSGSPWKLTTKQP